jgi:hypothetical protein
LLSNDEHRYEEYKKSFPDVFNSLIPTFLDGKPITGDKVAYMTYPRSGNTFLRKYLELITGVTTGSEVEASVWHLPLIGENIVDDSVWVIKSHGPIARVRTAEDFDMNKIIVLMRNPFAVIISMVHMCQTYSHFK